MTIIKNNWIIILLSLIVVFLYSLGILHSYACATQNKFLISVLSTTQNVLDISFTLGTKMLGSFDRIDQCNF